MNFPYVCLLVAGLFWLAPERSLVQCQCQWPSADRYIWRPVLAARLDSDRAVIDWIAGWLETLATEEPQATARHLWNVLEQIDSGQPLAAPFEGDRRSLRRYVHVLAQLARSRPLWCFYGDLDLFIGLVERRFGSLRVLAQQHLEADNKDTKLFRYLKHYGPDKFDRCSSSYYSHELEWTKRHLGGDFVRDLNQLIASQAPGEQVAAAASSQRRLFELASRLDFVEGHFDAASMSKVEVAFGRANQWAGSASRLIMFIDQRCERLLEAFRIPLNMVNIHRLLSPAAPIPFKVLKLNELSRLCRQFNEPQTFQAARANVRAQLTCRLCKLVRNLMMGRNSAGRAAPREVQGRGVDN